MGNRKLPRGPSIAPMLVLSIVLWMLFFALIGTMTGCTTTGSSLPSEMDWHTEDYPCPRGTVKVATGTGRNKQYACERVWMWR